MHSVTHTYTNTQRGERTYELSYSHPKKAKAAAKQRN